ncbi:hypothetical protein ACN28C_32115 [Plantactinospora sp. WMMC1484]|uniref:hypothetical protein n=1 Tax=Plantactinospora sp. WMMC1484 TaxID=3404122 RepID=UPI003BF5E9B1
METAELRRAYADLLAVAAMLRQLVAAMLRPLVAAMLRPLVAAMLRPLVAAMLPRDGGLAELADRLRDTSERLCGLVDRPGTEAETPVDSHLREGFELYVGESLPWGRMLDIHRRIHLPAHLERGARHAFRSPVATAGSVPILRDTSI